jgi:hypothetical protein
MAGSLKDALKKSGLTVEKVEAKQDHKKWKEELPEDDGKPYVPFDAPALTTPKDPPKKR